MIRLSEDRHVASDLLHRYGAILRQAWGDRRQNDIPVRLAHELAFLPANLELAEAPPHPAPLWTARILLAATLLIALIAAFGRLDIVAVAPGQLIPNANIKVIQPAVTGVVRRILVQNGERVVEGQLLVELDPTQATADADKAKTNKIDAQLTIARAQALLMAQAKNTEPKVARNAYEQGSRPLLNHQSPRTAEVTLAR
jgi:hemolysin D